MAKYERSFEGDFDAFLDRLHEDILQGSMSASYEDGSDVRMSDVRMAVRVYERYSMMGGNRVSLNITVLGYGEQIHLSAITSGGSQAVLFKLNTFGEEAFLDTCRDAVENYLGGRLH